MKTSLINVGLNVILVLRILKNLFEGHKVIIELNYSCDVLICTVPTIPNLAESGPQPDPGFAFRVRLGSAWVRYSGPRANPERTQSKSGADPEWTQSSGVRLGLVVTVCAYSQSLH